MFASCPIPKLIRNTLINYDNFDDLSHINSSICTDDSYNMVEMEHFEDIKYIVDESPLPESDKLQLKMPIPRKIMGSSNVQDIIKTPVLKKKHNPKLNARNVIPDNLNISKCIAYETHFLDKNDIIPTNFIIPSDQFTLNRTVQMIRSVVFETENLEEIVTKNNNLSEIHGCIFKTTIVYTGFDEYKNHRFAKIHIRIYEIFDKQNSDEKTALCQNKYIAIEISHLQGDSRMSMSVFRTIRDYVMSDGETECKVCLPDFSIGFADEYYLVMGNPDYEYLQ